MTHLRQLEFLVLCLLLLAGCQTLGEHSTMRSSEELARQGLAAAKTQNWPAAIDGLSRAAAQTGPNAANVFNLGLAQAGAGNSLAAAAWLRTYLAMRPGAPNAPQIRAEVRRLEGKAVAAVDTILDAALTVTLRLPEIRRHERYSEPGKLTALDTFIFSADRLGHKEIANRARRERDAIARRMGYEGFIKPLPYKWDFKARLEGASKAGDIALVKQLWAQATQEEREHPGIYLEAALSNLAKLSGTAAVREAGGLPPGLDRAIGYRRYVVQALLRQGEEETAKSFYREVRDQREWAAYYIAVHFLTKGDIQKSREWAGRCKYASNKYAAKDCAALLGDTAPAVDYYMHEEQNPFDTSHSYQVTAMAGYALQMGDTRAVRELLALYPQLAQNEARNTDVDYKKHVIDNKLYDAIQAQTALSRKNVELYRDFIDGDFSGAIAFAMDAKDTQWWGYRGGAFNADMLGFAIQSGRLKEAEAYTKAIMPLRAWPDIYRRMAQKADGLGDSKEAGRFRAAADAALVRARGGWRPENAQQLAAVNRWFDFAKSIQDSASTGDLKTALARAQEKDAKEAAESVIFIAGSWAEGIKKIAVLERYHPVMK